MIMLMLGGSVATTTVPGSFLPLQNPSTVTTQYDLSGLAQYLNQTLTLIGRGNYTSASFLLGTFGFVNIPSAVNATAQAAIADLASLNTTIPRAMKYFASADAATQADQLVNATRLVGAGCALVTSADGSFGDFSGPQTARLGAQSVPTAQYAAGENLVSGEIGALQGRCVPSSQPPPVLAIGSAEKSVETGGAVGLFGNITSEGTGISGQKVLFFVNGSYFGSLRSGAQGKFSGTLNIPFVYLPDAEVQALVARNSTIGKGGASSNRIYLSILFNQTSIAIGDPPAYLPGSRFAVHGTLTTTSGVPLPGAPVTVTYLRDSVATTTDKAGVFSSEFTVPDNATDGVYDVYARFSPRGVYGPSFNFTSVRVYHLGLRLALSVPGLSWAGFSGHVDGTATANGTAVAGASVTLSSPWGRSTATTDQDGRFSLSFPVSPLEFGFSRNVTISTSAAQPFIAGGTSEVTLGLFNVLLVILPAAVIGVGAYEANSLGVFRRVRGERGGGLKVATSYETVPSMGQPGREASPGPIMFLGRALRLASVRFSIEFLPSQTIREMLSQVRAKDDGEAFVAFSRVLLIAEDCLYGRGFDPGRADEARGALTELEALWSWK